MKQMNEAGINQRLAQLLYHAASGTVGWGLRLRPVGMWTIGIWTVG